MSRYEVDTRCRAAVIKNILRSTKAGSNCTGAGRVIRQPELTNYIAELVIPLSPWVWESTKSVTLGIPWLGD